MKDKTKTKTGRHHFKWMKYEGQNVRIDKEIAPLLANMWELGIKTTNSCQADCAYSCGHKWKEVKYGNGEYYSESIPTSHCHDHIWIVFDSVHSYELFLNAVAVYEPYVYDEPTTMYSLVCSTRKGGRKYLYRGNNNRWEVNFYPKNEGIDGHWKRHTLNGKRDGYEMWCEDGCKKNDFVVQPQLYFPRAHLSYVEQRIQLAVDKL